MTRFTKLLLALLTILFVFFVWSRFNGHKTVFTSAYDPKLIGSVILKPITKKTGPPARMQSFDMGKAHGRRITCTVIQQPYQYGEVVTVSFLATGADGKSVHFIQPAMGGFPDTVHFSTGDYATLGRKQFFISTAYGAAINHIYDCDGTRVRAIYTLADARQSARMVRRRERWFVVEQWRGDQYDDDNMGTGVWVNPPGKHTFGLIERRLYWNGHAFVPVHPGPTRIVPAKIIQRF